MAPADIEKLLDKEVSTLVRSTRAERSKSVAKRDVTFQELLRNKLLITRLIRSGVSYSFFELVKKTTPFTEPDWASFLDISTKSLQRYKQAPKKSFRFKPLQSEKIIEIAEVANVGEDVFGDSDKFRVWLETPSFALGRFRPIDLLKDSYGKELVLGELTRISHGILV